MRSSRRFGRSATGASRVASQASRARKLRIALRSTMPRTPPIHSGLPSLPRPTIVNPALPLPDGREIGGGGKPAAGRRPERVAQRDERAFADRRGFEHELVVARAERPGVGAASSTRR